MTRSRAGDACGRSTVINELRAADCRPDFGSNLLRPRKIDYHTRCCDVTGARLVHTSSGTSRTTALQDFIRLSSHSVNAARGSAVARSDACSSQYSPRDMRVLPMTVSCLAANSGSITILQPSGHHPVCTVLKLRASIAGRAAALFCLLAFVVCELASADSGGDSQRISAAVSLSDLDLATPMRPADDDGRDRGKPWRPYRADSRRRCPPLHSDPDHPSDRGAHLQLREVRCPESVATRRRSPDRRKRAWKSATAASD